MRNRVVWMAACLCGAIAGLAAGCAKPTIVEQGGRRYSVAERGEELFVYVEYRWGGGKFDDAKRLERDFAAWGAGKGILAYAMGRFPTLRDWQLGFAATAAPADAEFLGHDIESAPLPAGRWATVTTRGEIDYLFRYWRKAKRWVERDGLATDGPVVEVYPYLLAGGAAPGDVRGEIRYHLEAD